MAPTMMLTAALLLVAAAAAPLMAAAAVNVAEVGVPISIALPSAAESAAAAAAGDDDPLGRAKVTLCALDWAAYRADPAAAPMFRDIVALSQCSKPRNRAIVSFADLEREYEERGCAAAATSPPLPAAAGTAAGAKGAGCVPTGMVFHQSRCGSTLVANMLAAVPEALSYSESSPPMTVLSATHLSERDRVRALRVVVAAMGRPVHLHALGRDVPHADNEWDPQHLFFKFQSALTMQLATARRAFPAVPWAFVHRDGVEVLASLLRGAPVLPADPATGQRGGLDPNDATVLSAPCMRSRDTGPHPALLAVTGAATATDARALAPEDFCAANVGLLAASALHHAREARREGLARAGLLPIAAGAGSSSSSSSSGAADGGGAAAAPVSAPAPALDVGDGDDVSHVAAASGGAVVALGGMLLDSATGRGTVAGVGQGVFVDYPLLPDAAVGLVRSHFGAPIDDDSVSLMMEESTRYSKARMADTTGKKAGGASGAKEDGGEAAASAPTEQQKDKRRSRKQEEEGHYPRPAAAASSSSAADTTTSSSGLRARPGMDADGNFVGDARHKREHAWPELRSAADRYVSGVRAAMLRFNTPADGVSAAAADPALQALLRAFSPAGPAMAEATVAAAGLRASKQQAGGGAGDGGQQGERGGGSDASSASSAARRPSSGFLPFGSRAASVEGLPSLPGPLAAAALGLYGPDDAAPLEVGFNATRHVLPLGQGYPMLFPLTAMLAEWNPDVTTPPPTYGRYSSLRYFDWSSERAEAERYRRAEVPFVVRGVPSLVAAAKKWASDERLMEMMGADKLYEAQAVEGNHFMYFSRGRGEAKDWVPPTQDAKITVRDWLTAAHRVAGEVAAEERAAMPDWWFASPDLDTAASAEGGGGGGGGAPSAAASAAASRVDVSEAVAPPKNRRPRRLHYVRATAYPEEKRRHNNAFILDELPLFDPVYAKPRGGGGAGGRHHARKPGPRAANALRGHERPPPRRAAAEEEDGAPADDGSAAAADPAAQPVSARAAAEAPFFIIDDSQQRGVHCRLGMAGTIAENHYDGSRNFITMQRGRRRYILAPPSECANMALLTEGPSSRHSEVDWSDPAQHGSLANALALEVVLEPGDALYLPAAWFHYIVSLSGVSVQCNSRSGKPVLYIKELAQCGFHISNLEPLGEYTDPDAAAKQPDRARHAAAHWRHHWPSLAAVARGLGKEEVVLRAQRQAAAQQAAAEGGTGKAGSVAADRMAAAVAATLSARQREYGEDVEAAEAEAAKAAAEREDAETARAAAAALPMAAGALAPVGAAGGGGGSGAGGWGNSAEAVRARKAAVAAAAVQENKMWAIASAADWAIGRHHERVLRGFGLGGGGGGGAQQGGGGGGGGGLFARVASTRVVAGGFLGCACVSAVTAARAWMKKRKQSAKGSKAR